MRYLIDGNEVTRTQVQDQLTAEMKEAENSPYFMGRVFYNLDYIERVAERFMRANRKMDFHFDNVVLIAD